MKHLLRLLRGPDVPQLQDDIQVDYRNMLKERAERGERILLLLDNVADQEQIQHLAPMNLNPAHRIIATCRTETRLDGFHLFKVEPLSPDDGADLLIQLLDNGSRADDDRAAAVKLAELCCGLPLALDMMACRLNRHPEMPIARMVKIVTSDVRPGSARMAEMQDGGERRMQDVVESHLRWAASTKPRLEALFPLLAVNPGPHLSTTAAARIWDVDDVEARDYLDTLRVAGLVDEHREGPDGCDDTGNHLQMRWGMRHDLIWQFAWERVQVAPGRAAAFERMVELYRDQAKLRAWLAGYHLLRHSRPLDVPEKMPPEPSRAKALDWFRTEKLNLLGCVQSLKNTGTATPRPAVPVTGEVRTLLVQLLDAMAGFLRNDGPWDEAAELYKGAAIVADELGDTRAEAVAYNDLGIMLRLLQNDRALSALHDAERLYGRLRRWLRPRRSGLLGRANSLNEQGIVHNEEAKYDPAAKVLRRALRLYRRRRVQDEIGEANAKKNLGIALHRPDDPRRRQDAARYLTEAEDIYATRLRDDVGIAEVNNKRGGLLVCEGRRSEARRAFEVALSCAKRADSALEEARAQMGLGELLMTEGRRAEAVARYELAHRLFTSVGAREADDVAALLLRRGDGG
jgi:tetratricopeptide (TPR) repeat protein